MDLDRIIEILIKKVDSEYRDDVAIICVYGSYIYNATHAKSDIDFYFVPKSQRAYDLANTFIIDEIGFDFWPISWERAESIASYNQGFVSLVADAHVVWYGTNDDLTHFQILKEKSIHPMVNWINRQKEIVSRCEHLYFEMCTDLNFASQKQLAVNLITSIVELLAIINHTYTHRGWSHSIDEIAMLKNTPEEFKDQCRRILCSTKSNEIILSTTNLLTSIKVLMQNDTVYSADYVNTFTGLYEEEKSLYNKLYHSCDIGDEITAIMAGASIQEEIISIMGNEKYTEFFSDVVKSFSPDDLESYKKHVKSHEKLFCKFIDNNRIHVRRYNSINDFENEMSGNK